MSRPRKPSKPSALHLWQRLVCTVIVVGPPIYLTGTFVNGVIRYLDAILSQSAPLASAFASGSLGREVKIGAIKPLGDRKLTVAELWKTYRGIDKLGTLPIIANDIYVANGATLSGTGELAYVRELRLFVSVPALLTGKSNSAVTVIEVQSPRLYLVRRKDGSFNVQELVKKDTKAPGPPFLTTIELADAAIRFEDRATKFPQAQTNDLYPVEASAVLGARSLRFDLKATPKAGTVSARRLRRPIIATGTLAQGKPGSRPDTALPTDPQYTLRAQVPDADVPYFVRYLFGKLPNFAANSGRASNVALTFVGPTVAQALAADATVPKGKLQPSILFSANLVGIDGRVQGVPSPVENIGGPVRFVSAGDLISFDLTGSAFAAPVALTGSVWGLTTPAKAGGPRLAVRFNAPRIPLSRVLTAFKTALPTGVSLTGDTAARGFVTGTLSDLAGNASLSVPRVAVQGATTIQDIHADLAYGKGVLQVSRLTAQTDLGGAVSGTGRVRFGEIVRGGTALRILPQNQITTNFSVQAERVSLPRIAALAKATKVAKQVSLTGAADVVASGSTIGKRVFATADVAARGLSLSGIPFSVAQARVSIQDNALVLPLARFESPTVGSLYVDGDTSLPSSTKNPDTPIALRFAASALDAGKIARALRIADVAGVLNASGTVTGTLSAPRLSVARFSVLNPRYQKYNLQSITGANITATKDAVTIPTNSPVVVRRFPATVSVTGQVRSFLPATPTAKPRPRLALNTHVTNVDYSTIAPFLPQPKDSNGKPPPQFAGTLTEASARITGFADAPRIEGNGELRSVLLGDYPVESGSFRFAYQDGVIAIPAATVTASVGTISAKGRIRRTGEVEGTFEAPALDLARISYLTEDTATLGGILAIRGTFSGTRDRPVVTASVSPSDIVVAGVPINNLAVTNARYIANLEQNVQRIEIPRVSLEQEGNTQILVEGGSYDFKRKSFGAALTLRSDSVATLLTGLRESAFAQTQRGKQALAGLSALPTPLDAGFPATRPDSASGYPVPTNRIVIAGNAGEKGLANYRVQGEVYATNLRAGQYAVGTLRIGLDKGQGVDVPAGQPNIQAQVEADNLQIADFVAQQVRASGSLIGELATIQSARLISDAGTIDASGTIGLGKNGQINALVDSNAVPLDLVRAFVPTLPLSGSVAFSVTATGPTQTPNIRASLEGQDILVVSRTDAGQKVPDTESASKTEDAPNPEVARLSLVRAIARLGVDDTGKRFIELSDAQVSREGGGRLEAEARIPFSYSAPYIPPTEPLSIQLRFPAQELKDIRLPGLISAVNPDSGKPQEKATEVPGFTGGKAQGAITLGGTLRAPDLSGLITIQDAGFQFKKILGRETLNAIADADATITLAGSKINVDSTVKLAKPGRGRGDNGTVALKGDITVRELETALNALSAPPASVRAPRNAPPPPAFGAGTTLNLLATFTGFEPVENNFLNLNESFRGKIDGSIAVTTPGNKLTISTPKGSPLVVQNVRLTPPSKANPTQEVTVPVPAPPYFAIEIDAPGKNNISLGGIVSVDVSGTASINGSLGSPSIAGTFLTQGGTLQYLLGRFTLDKGGEVSLNYSGNAGSVEFSSNNPVTARTTAYLRSGESLSGDSQTRGGPPIASAVPSADSRGTRYKITEQLTGKFNFGANSDGLTNTFKLIPSSDPPLTPSQIYALLIPRSQLAGLAAGNFQQVGQQLLETAFNQAVIPGLFSPIEEQVANAFGLEAFSLDYSPSAPLTVNFLKRLPDPLNRFLVSYSRTLQTSGLRTGGPTPFTAGLLFEVFELRSRPNQPIPRIQFGISTNEQRNVTTDLRATILY